MKDKPTNEGFGVQQPDGRPLSLTRLASAIRSRFTRSAVRYGGIAAAFSPSLVLAGPFGEQVVAGDVQVARPDSNTTEILQGSSRAVLNWQGFSIGRNEYVQFNQPSSTAIALNRVVGQDPSAILGRLDANGRVFLVNPHGVYFGPGARVDVGGLVASVHDISDQDFLDGRYVFAQTAESAGSAVMNEGVITAADGGYVVLSGDRVQNDGIIQAQLGTVVLASGRSTTLSTDAGGGLVDFAIDEATLSDVAGVSNTGDIIADGGTVLLAAKLASDLAATAVNNEGLVQANSIVEQGGRVFLRGSGGDVVNAGTVDVSGSGDATGGVVIVKSDEDIDLPAGSVIDASGDGSGDGGMVRVIADGTLNFQADAKVAASAGDVASPVPQAEDGFIELSGHENFTIAGEIGLDGPGGTLLIDPPTLLIANDSGLAPISGATTTVPRGFLENQLGVALNDVILIANSNFFANSGNLGGPTFTVNGTGGGSGGDLTLRIGTNPNFSTGSPTGNSLGYGGGCSAGVCVPGTSFSSAPLLGGNVNIPTIDFVLDGSFTVSAPDGTVNLGNISANGVTIDTGTNGSIVVDSINGGGSATLTGRTIGINTAVMAGQVVVNLNGLNGSIVGGLIESIPPAPGFIDFNVAGTNALIAVDAHTPTINVNLVGGTLPFMFINNTVTGSPFATETATLNGANWGDVTILFDGNGNVLTPAGASAPVTFNSLALESFNGNLSFNVNNDFQVATETFLDAGGTVNLANLLLDTGALWVEADNSISSNVTTKLKVGAQSFSGSGPTGKAQPGDSSLLSQLSTAGIPGTFSAPNAIFKAPIINVQGLDIQPAGLNSYLLFDPDQLTLGPVLTNTGQNVLVQVLGATPTTLIGVESSSATGTNCGGVVCGASFFADTLFNSFPNNGNITFGVGGFGQTGNVFVGQNGIVNLGSQNLVVVTGGSINNPANVTTSGIVSSVGTIVGGVVPPVSGGGSVVSSGEIEEIFPTPVPTEFEEEQEEEEEESLVLQDDEGEGGDVLGFEEQPLTCS